MAIERGLDISGHQSPTNTTLLGLLAQPLYTFVICKATEGVGLDDSKYILHRANNAKYPGLSRAARPLAYLGPSRRKPWDSNPHAARSRHLFSRQAPGPAGWLP